MQRFRSAFSISARWLRRQGTDQSVVLVVLSIFVGVSSGAGVWLFKRLIDLFHEWFTLRLITLLAPPGSGYGGWAQIIPLILGGLIVGLAARTWTGRERHHGVAGIMEAVALSGGRLPYQRVALKAAASALSIGVGASVGPEDPSVQIGANLGSMVGQRLRLGDERTRSLVAAGAAGGIAAAFNAPIAAVFFALEIILGELSGSSLSVVVLSSVISAVFTQALSGPEPAFHVPAYSFGSIWELPFYLVLGLLAGVVAAAYIRMLYAARDVFARVPVPDWVRPAIAGLIVGTAGIFLPQVLGVGYGTIAEIFAAPSLSVGFLLILLVAKLVLTPVSIGGGFQGGVFAPSLFLGAALGGAFGVLCRATAPGLDIVPGAFAMVGMAAVLAGAVHAPLTAILLLFEMTNDYRIILPLMFAVMISLIVSQRLHQESVYSLSLLRHGIRLDRGRDIEVMEGLKVGEVMSTNELILHVDDPLLEVQGHFEKTHSHGFPVVDEHGDLVGILSIHDLEAAQSQGVDFTARAVGDICVRDILVARPDETLSEALHRMSVNNVGRLPVVDPGNPRRLIGLLRRADVIRAYGAAVSRRVTSRHRAQQVRLSTLAHLPVEETVVEAHSMVDGKPVHEITWPREAILASIRRGKRILIPHGSTVLRKGDEIVFVTESPDALKQVEEMCRCAENESEPPESS